MPNYYFETPEFGISDTGIHYLRSRFNYKTVPYTDIHSARIEQGKDLNNWALVLSIGIALVAFGLYYFYRLYIFFFEISESRTIAPEQILLPIIPFLVGGYCIYSATRNCIVMRFTDALGKPDKLSLRELQKNNQLEVFISTLRPHLGTRLTSNL
jgi:hypothetical protein